MIVSEEGGTTGVGGRPEWPAVRHAVPAVMARPVVCAVLIASAIMFVLATNAPMTVGIVCAVVIVPVAHVLVGLRVCSITTGRIVPVPI